MAGQDRDFRIKTASSLGAVINVEVLQSIMADFHGLTGIATAITDLKGNVIAGSGWQDICTKFHRIHPQTVQNCIESDLHLAKTISPGKYKDYQCKNGLWDVIIPLYIGKRHMGNIYTGQFFYDDDLIDEQKFIQQAEKYGFNKKNYLEAFSNVPKYSRKAINQLMQFLVKVTSHVSNASYATIRLEQEIRDRKRAEQILLNTTRKLQSITDSSLDGIIVIDNKGHILFWNPAAEQIFGYSHQEAMGRNLHQLLMPQYASDSPGNEFSIPRQARHGNRINRTIELEAIRKNGETITIELSLSSIHPKDDWNAVGIVRDITNRKKTQEMLIQSEKMLSVGGLAAGMAHEINNPLAGMVQTIQVIAQRLKSGPKIPANQKAAEAAGITMDAIEQFMEDRGIQKMIGIIIEAGNRASNIVNNMLNFARKNDTVLSLHALNKILDKTIELAATDYDLKHAYDFKQIHITREYDENLPDVPCQANKIQQVLLNILTNGAQAMQGAGTQNPKFIIKTYVDIPKNMACIEIQDNGPGMDEKTSRKIFDPFFTTKPEGIGTGLGLSVSYFIITENHKGEITINSNPGEGATFTIGLPLSVDGGQQE